MFCIPLKYRFPKSASSAKLCRFSVRFSMRTRFIRFNFCSALTHFLRWGIATMYSCAFVVALLRDERPVCSPTNGPSWSLAYPQTPPLQNLDLKITKRKKSSTHGSLILCILFSAFCFLVIGLRFYNFLLSRQILSGFNSKTYFCSNTEKKCQQSVNIVIISFFKLKTVAWQLTEVLYIELYVPWALCLGLIWKLSSWTS